MKIHQAASKNTVATQVNAVPSLQRIGSATAVIDNRVAASAQLQRQNLSDQSPQAMQLKKHLASLNQVAQRAEDDELVQGKFSETPVTQRAEAAPNNTGLPNQLKSGIESLSGMSMDHVKVHYNSAQPAQLNAHAYAQGSEIHVAPGQEQHLPHEAWHVVQQAQGRVKPTMQMKMGVPVNDDAGLETEADVMGERAVSLGAQAIQAYSMSADSEKSKPSEIQRYSIQKKNIYQLVRTAPAITGNAAITAGPANALNRDAVAIGPTNVDAFTITTGAAVSHDAAMTAIRTEYTNIGQGFAAPGAGVTGVFLYGAGLRNRCNADRPTAGAVYDTLLAAGTIGAHAAPAPSPQQKQQHLQAQMPRAELAPANMELLRNNVAMPWHDPIEANIQAPYGLAGAVLETRVDFTEGQKGYVSRVQSHGSDATIDDRPNYAGEFPRADPRSAGLQIAGAGVVNPNAIATYSNVHHTATNESAGTQIGRLGGADTLSHLEGGLDAITKVVAEGGRFQCVAALGNNITNDTKFYTRDGLDPGPISVKYIEFRQLWTRWTSGFGGAYGIPNLLVKNYIDAGRPGVVTVIPHDEADIPNVCPAPHVDLT